MLKPYDILTRCQLELKKCELLTIDKLQIEMNILKAKQSMIDYIFEDEIENMGYIEEEAKKAYNEICKFSSSTSNAGDVSGIIFCLQNIVESMKATERNE